MYEKRIVGCLLAVVFVLWCPSPRAHGQAGATAKQTSSAAIEYDVATVRVNNTGSGSSHLSIDRDTLLATNVKVTTLLEAAYDIRPDEIVGLPHWAQVDRYDLAAKVVNADPQQIRTVSDDQERVMLQHLLEARFHLRTHIESRVLPLMELIVDKGGIKFTEWQEPSNDQHQRKGSMNEHNGDMTATGVPMGFLAQFLSRLTHMPVVDETGLKGIYSFHLKWQREEGQDSGLHDQPVPTIYEALPEQMGLKLESGKGPVNVLVIDNSEQPGDN